MKLTPSPPADALVDLGFTGLESDIYVHLLRTAPATGHAIARGVGRANANVYKALESLETKGAVVVEESEPRQYRPVEVDVLLRQLDRSFADRRRRAEAALADLTPAPPDDAIYRIASADQLLERAHSVIENASFALLADGDAPLIDACGRTLESASARGVHVLVKTYRDLDLDGPRLIQRPRPEEITGDAPGTFAVFAADGREFLLGRMNHEGAVQQAIWTASPMLAFQGYMGLINELTLTEIMRCLERDAPVEEIRRAFERDRPLHPNTARNPVYENLMTALGHRSPAPRPSKETA